MPAQSKARHLSSLLTVAGFVKDDRSLLAGSDAIIDLASLPAITNAKLTFDDITINSQTINLGDSATLTTSNITEGTNLYHTTARARGVLVPSTGLSYDSSTGVINITNSGVTAGTYGEASGNLLGVTIDATGRITATTTSTFDSSFDTRLANVSTSDLSEGTNQYHTTQRVRDALSAGDDLTYDSSTGRFSIDVEAKYTKANFDSDFNVAMDSGSTDDLSEGSTNLYHTTARARNAIGLSDLGGDGSLAYDSASGRFTYTGPSASEVRAHLTANKGLSVTNGEFNIDSSNVRGMFSGAGDLSYNSSTGEFSFTDSSQHTSAQIRAMFSGAGDLSYNSSTGEFSYTDSERSVGSIRSLFSGDKGLAYNASTGVFDVDSSNVKDMFSAAGDLSYNSSTGEFSITVSDASVSDSGVRQKLSVNDAGGDGSLSYDSGTGIFTYTGPSASETRAHFSGGTGVTITNGSVAIGQSVGTTDSVTFGGMQINGNLVVTGTRTEINTETLTVDDNIIVLNNNYSGGSPTENAGIEVERGTVANVSLRWNEGGDKWQFTDDGSNFYDILNADSAKNLFSATTSGTGHGGLSYNDGVFTYAKVTDANIRSAISEGTGISISSGQISSNDGEIVHDNLSGFVSNEHIDHSGVSITAGNGLTGGGDITTSRTINVVGGNGINVNANNVEIDSADIRNIFSVSGDLSYDSSTGQFSFSETYSSAAELLTAIKTVDGATSGLDADLLDGQHGSHYRINVYDASGTLQN